MELVYSFSKRKTIEDGFEHFFKKEESSEKSSRWSTLVSLAQTQGHSQGKGKRESLKLRFHRIFLFLKTIFKISQFLRKIQRKFSSYTPATLQPPKRRHLRTISKVNGNISTKILLNFEYQSIKLQSFKTKHTILRLKSEWGFLYQANMILYETSQVLLNKHNHNNL